MQWQAGQLDAFAALGARSALVVLAGALLGTAIVQAARCFTRPEVPFCFGMALPLALYTAATWPAMRGKLPIADVAFWPAVVILLAVAAAYASPLLWKASPFRLREAVERLRGMRAALLVLLAASACYALLAPDARLPVLSTGNEDVWYYAKLARIALDPMADNLAGFELLPRPAAQATPTSFLFLAGLSLLTGSDVVDIIGVATILLLTLSFLLVRRIAERHCGLPAGVAAFIAAIWATSGFSIYLAGHFFLAQQIAIVCYLAILHVALTQEVSPSFRIATLVLLHYLLAMTYPGLFPVYAIVFWFALTANHLLGARLGGPREATATLVAGLLAPPAAVGLMGLLGFSHLVETVRLVASYSDAALGWKLDLVNPLEFLSGAAYLPDKGGMAAKLAGFGLLVGLAAAGFAAGAWQHRQAVQAALNVRAWQPANMPGLAVSTTVVLLYLGALAGYLAYYALSGPSYQQWKLAASAAFPLAFVPLAVAWKTASAFWPPGWSLRWLALPGIVLLGANVNEASSYLREHAVALDSYAPLRSLQALDGRPEVASVDIVVMGNRLAVKIASQFVNRKIVTRSQGFSHPPVPAGTVTFSNLCPILEQPRLAYLGNRFCTVERAAYRDAYEVSFAAGVAGTVEAVGLGPAEPWGTWSHAGRVVLGLPLDPAWNGVSVHVSGQPFIAPACVASQRLVFSIGNDRLREVALTQDATIDLLIPPERLPDRRLLTLTIDFPDAVAPKTCGLDESIWPRAFGLRTINVAKAG